VVMWCPSRVLPWHDLHFDMYKEHHLIDSSLNQTYSADGRSVEIHIYRMPHTGGTLEVVNDLNNSTVWDGEFATYQEALDTAMAEMNAEGIEAFIMRPRDQPTYSTRADKKLPFVGELPWMAPSHRGNASSLLDHHKTKPERLLPPEW
jgi:hypothetical protein